MLQQQKMDLRHTFYFAFQHFCPDESILLLSLQQKGKLLSTLVQFDYWEECVNSPGSWPFSQLLILHQAAQDHPLKADDSSAACLR